MRLFWVSVVVACVVAAYLGHQAIMRYIPVSAMNKAEKLISARIGGYNLMSHPPLPTAESRTVVRQSPDLLYSACVYDISRGPVEFTGVIPEDAYWSLSFYAHNTDNFYVLNDRDLAGPDYRLVLSENDAEPPENTNPDIVVHSPSKTGIAVQRIFVDSDNRLEELDSQRKSARCRPLSKS